jgi:hypothetical protein
MDEKLLNRIIAAAYNDCSLYEKLKTWIEIRNKPDALKLYKIYSNTASTVHGMPELKCPDKVLEKTEDRIHLTGFRSNQFLRPAAAFAVIFIAAVAAMFSVTNKPVEIYTAAEVETAQVQARQSLEIVSRILNRTTATLGEEIFPEKVSKPVQDGLDIINNLLIGG